MAVSTHPVLPARPGECQPGWTWEDYRALTPPDGEARYELIEGDLTLSPAPNRRHQLVAGGIYRRLCEALGHRGEVLIAPFDMRLGPATVVQPDVLVVLAENRGRLLDTHLEGPCDLAVEVLSAATRGRDRHVKRGIYAEHRIPEYWLVDADAGAITCWQLAGDEYPAAPLLGGEMVLPSRVIPGEPRPVRWWLNP